MVRIFGTYEFEGPFEAVEHISVVPGVFIVVDSNDSVIACGESEDLRESLSKRGSADWQERTGGHFAYWVHYTRGMSDGEREFIFHSIEFHYHLAYLRSV